MGKVLSEDQVRGFDAEGYLTPLRAISTAEAAEVRRRLEAFESETGQSTDTLHMKSHLYFKWLYELTHHPRILGAFEDLIGPDFLVMASRFWIKDPQDRKFVTWHQDATYFGLDPQKLITLWLALTPVTAKNGCMRIIPGSHKGGIRKHVETHEKDNMLSRGQRVDDLDPSTAREVLLEPGEFSLHDGVTLHSSEANSSEERRIGFAWMVVPAHVRSTTGRRAATLVHGEDKYGYWDHDPEPKIDRDPAIYALMQASLQHYKTAAK
jgi:ectoine hydroxylase-related dioxygenase (phytanoyl-CoA dioxygenase family)